MLGLAKWVRDPALPVSCGIGGRCSSDLASLWLWQRPAAVALIRPLVWEPPYAEGAALKSKRKKKKEKNLLYFVYNINYSLFKILFQEFPSWLSG